MSGTKPLGQVWDGPVYTGPAKQVMVEASRARARLSLCRGETCESACAGRRLILLCGVAPALLTAALAILSPSLFIQLESRFMTFP